MLDAVCHLNHKEIDRQHKVLFSLFDQCKAALEEKNNKKVMIIVHDLVKYGIEHFRYEEDAMIYSKYPTKLYDEHVFQHALFKSKMIEIIKNPDFDSGLKLLDYIKNWFTSHINVIDRKLVNYLDQLG